MAPWAPNGILPMPLFQASLLSAAMTTAGISRVQALQILRTLLEGSTFPLNIWQRLHWLTWSWPTQGQMQAFRFFEHSFNDPPGPSTEGLSYNRVCGSFPTMPGHSREGFEVKPPLFRERRAVVVVSLLPRTTDVPPSQSQILPFRVLVMIDNSLWPQVPFKFRAWKKNGLKMAGRFSGYHAFQAAIYSVLTIWEQKWSRFLDAMDQALTTKVGFVTLTSIPQSHYHKLTHLPAHRYYGR